MKLVVTERWEMGSKAVERSVEIIPEIERGETEGEPHINLPKVARLIHKKLTELKYTPAPTQP